MDSDEEKAAHTLPRPGASHGACPAVRARPTPSVSPCAAGRTRATCAQHTDADRDRRPHRDRPRQVSDWWRLLRGSEFHFGCGVARVPLPPGLLLRRIGLRIDRSGSNERHPLARTAPRDDPPEGAFRDETLDPLRLLDGHVLLTMIVASDLRAHCEAGRNRQDEFRTLSAPTRAEIVQVWAEIVERQNRMIAQGPFGVAGRLDNAPPVLADDSFEADEHTDYRREPRGASRTDFGCDSRLSCWSGCRLN
jgi:hypothetical protein